MKPCVFSGLHPLKYFRIRPRLHSEDARGGRPVINCSPGCCSAAADHQRITRTLGERLCLEQQGEVSDSQVEVAVTLDREGCGSVLFDRGLT